MKGKLSFKVLGILVALAMLASLIVGVTASPVSAAPATLGWGTISTPSNVNYVLGGYSEITAASIGNPVVNLVAASPTGSAIFAWDGTNETLYKSTDGKGAVWTAAAKIAVTGAIALVVSPNYATDNAVALATPTQVWISTNGGGSFTNVSPTLLATQTITSMDLGYWFTTGNVLTALVGLANPKGGTGIPVGDAYTSNVIDYTFGAFGWSSVGSSTAVPPTNEANSVYGVKFSTHAITDGEAMCVYYTAAGALWISSDFGSLGFANAAYPDNAIVGAAANGSAVTVPLNVAPTSVEIAMATDYTANTGASVFVAVNGTNAQGLYRVSGRANGDGSTVSESNTAAITSLAVSGPIATATVFAGTTSGISWSNTSTASPPSWSGSAGLYTITNADVVVAGAMVVAGTTGMDGGVSISNNLGSSFLGVGLLNTGSGTAVLPIVLDKVKIANATTMFLTMANTGTQEQYVFMTTNAGTSWQRIYVSAVSAAVTKLMVAVSSAYATDSTVVVSDGTSLLHESNNGGVSWSSVGVAATTVTSVKVINASNIFVGTAGGVYKVGSFAQGATDSSNTVSFAVSPMDKTLATFLVGQSDGTVWQTTNNGSTFTELGGSLATGNAMVAYGPDGTQYAAVGSAVWSYSASAAAWTQINSATSGVINQAVDLAVATNGVMYVGDSNVANFVQRSLNPNQEYAASGAGAPTFCSMAFGGQSTGTLSWMAVLSATTGNTVYVIDNAQPAQSGYGYSGCIEGFVDTMAVAPTKLVPANAAVVSFPGNTPSVTLSWAAVTGATDYQVVLNGSLVAVAGQVYTTNTNSYTFTANYGSAYTWSVYVYGVGTALNASSFLGLPSATQSFTTALAAIPVAQAVLNPAQGATGVALSGFNFVWPADQTDLNAGLTVTYQFALAQASANTSANEFAILDYSDNTATNAETLQEALQPNAQYWWEVRSVALNGSGGIATYGAWQINTFTTMPAPVTTTSMAPTTVVTSVVITQPVTTVVSTQTSVVITQNTGNSTPAIPSYLLWAVIAVGAILIIAVIILIVRTRRIP